MLKAIEFAGRLKLKAGGFCHPLEKG